MAAPYHGKTSNAFWDTTAIPGVTGWSVALHCTTADSTSRHATETGRTREIGYKGGTATVTCKTGSDFLPLAGASAVLELLRDTTDASKGYEGTATCTGASASHGHSDVAETTYTFQWDGTVTCTVTEGSD